MRYICFAAPCISSNELSCAPAFKLKRVKLFLLPTALKFPGQHIQKKKKKNQNEFIFRVPERDESSEGLNSEMSRSFLVPAIKEHACAYGQIKSR